MTLKFISFFSQKKNWPGAYGYQVKYRKPSQFACQINSIFSINMSHAIFRTSLSIFHCLIWQSSGIQTPAAQQAARTLGAWLSRPVKWRTVTLQLPGGLPWGFSTPRCFVNHKSSKTSRNEHSCSPCFCDQNPSLCSKQFTEIHCLVFYQLCCDFL